MGNKQCSVKKCDKIKKKYSIYCKNHECYKCGCGNLRNNDKCCNDHINTCILDICCNKVNGYDYCEEHKCSNKKCNKRKGCPEHTKCMLIRCKNTIAPHSFSYCVDHICMAEDCYQIRKNHKYCENHRCCIIGCNNISNKHSICWCEQHRCNVSSCYNSLLCPDHKYINKENDETKKEPRVKKYRRKSKKEPNESLPTYSEAENKK